jgi:hypothetical protein
MFIPYLTMSRQKHIRQEEQHMSKFATTAEQLSSVLSHHKDDMKKTEVSHIKATIKILEQLNESYNATLNAAVEYAINHMQPIVTRNPEVNPGTLKGFTTVVYTTKTALSDPSFDAALKEYPDVSHEDLESEITANADDVYNIVTTDLFRPEVFTVDTLCVITNFVNRNGARVGIRTHNNMDMKQILCLGGIKGSYVDDYTFYCKDGQLQMDQQHYDGTNNAILLRVIDNQKYSDYLRKNPVSYTDKSVSATADEMIAHGIAVSLVPEIAGIYGITLK